MSVKVDDPFTMFFKWYNSKPQQDPDEPIEPDVVEAEVVGEQSSGGNWGTSGSGSTRMESIARWGKRAIIVAIIVLLIILIVSYWWFHPAINIHSADTWGFVSFFILLPLYIFFTARSHYHKTGQGEKAKPGRAKTMKNLSRIPIAILLIGLIGAILSAPFIPGNALKYSNVLPVKTLEFTEDIQQVNYNEIPVIDKSSAELLGNRTMGAMSDLVSQFEVSGLYSQINYQDKPVRVSPLNYAGIIKWLQNRTEGIPAYVIVDMTSQNAQVVRLGSGEEIHYSTSEPLARNIDRYVQLKYPTYMFDEKAFEIDDEGTPMWVCPVRDYTIGLFGGVTVDRVVLVNASTGETTEYAIEDVPSWIDRAFPSDMLIKQYNWKGAYTDGWFNSWLGQKGVVQTTPGTDGRLGYNYIAKDDDVWVYTGVTSATADNSIIGFILVNQRTGEGHFYAMAGATEESAMLSAEGQVQNLEYTATFPILINVSGRPTYFMALKDSAGLVKKYAMVDIVAYQNVAVGDTVAMTQTNYERMLAISGDITVDSSTVKDVTGVVKTVATAVVEGNSHVYVTLEGKDTIYDFPLPGLIEAVAFEKGDVISFTAIDGQPVALAQELS